MSPKWQSEASRPWKSASGAQFRGTLPRPALVALLPLQARSTRITAQSGQPWRWSQANKVTLQVPGWVVWFQEHQERSQPPKSACIWCLNSVNNAKTLIPWLVGRRNMYISLVGERSHRWIYAEVSVWVQHWRGERNDPRWLGRGWGSLGRCLSESARRLRS